MAIFLMLVWLGWTGLSSGAVRGDADSFYNTYDFAKKCLPHQKLEINMRTGAALFVLDERRSGEIERLGTNQGNFMCHFELETSRNYGFHVYIDEMSLEESPVVPTTGKAPECKDYLQFGRDVLYWNTHSSPHYCGQRSRMPNNSTAVVFTGGEGNRMYVEEVDKEMDVWLMLAKRSPDTRPRVLYMVVTVIKKGCGNKDLYYRQCQHTKHCVRREFFCDGRVNCAWPSAEAGGTDEVNCDHQDAHGGGPLNEVSLHNLPIIIIIVIVLAAMVVIGAVICKKFATSIFKPDRQDSVSENRRIRDVPAASSSLVPRQPATGDLSETTPALLGHHGHPDAGRVPSAPPSYDDVVKDSNPAFLVAQDDPPPYSPTPPDPIPTAPRE